MSTKLKIKESLLIGKIVCATIRIGGLSSMLNNSLEEAKKEVTECQKRTNEVVEALKAFLNAFASDGYVQELFAKTGFGVKEEQELDKILTKLTKITNALDTYVPKTISTINYQMELNNANGQ